MRQLVTGVFLSIVTMVGMGCSPGLSSGVVSAPLAPKGLRLSGEVKEDNLSRQFEIIFDGSHYCRREWYGSEWGHEHGGNTIHIILPYWSGKGSGSGRGGYGYFDCREIFAPARRLWPGSGLTGASEQELVFRNRRVEEVFSDLRRHGSVDIPHRIRVSESLTDTVYTVKEVEFFRTSPADAIIAMKRQYFGDTRYKSSNCPDGTKFSDHIHDGELPVLDMEWYPDGKIKSARVNYDGIPTTDIRWHPNGQKEVVSFWRGGGRYAWTRWLPDGVKATEGCAEGQTQWSISYYRDGKKRELRHERDGKLDGVYQSWDENGALVNDGIYRNGMPWSGTFRTMRNVPYTVGMTYRWQDGKLIQVATTGPATD